MREELQGHLRLEERVFFSHISADVSHEIRNVLSVIGEHAGLLDDLLATATRRKPLDPDRLKKIALGITRQVQKGTEIMERFSCFAHAADEPRAASDLTALTGNLASLAQRHVTLAGSRLKAELPEEAVPVRADPYRLQQALFAALELVLACAEKGETVTVKLVCQRPMATISVTGKAAAGGGGLSSQLDQLAAVVNHWGGTVNASEAEGMASLAITIPVE